MVGDVSDRDSKYELLLIRIIQAGRSRAGSVPDGVIGIFHSHNPSGLTVTLGSTYLLTEMITRNISLGDCLGIGEPHPPGTPRAWPLQRFFFSD